MRRLLWFSVGFACACLAAASVLPEAVLCWAALLFAALTLGLWLLAKRSRQGGALPARQRWRRIVRVLALGTAVGLLWCWGYQAWILAPAQTLTGSKQTLTAEVCGYAEETEFGHRTDALLDPDGLRIRTRIYLYGDVPPLRPGDRITGSFSVRRADQTADGRTDLSIQAKGLLLVASGRIAAVEDGDAPLRYFPARLSRAVFSRLDAVFPADVAGLPQAMLTGTRSGLSVAAQSSLSTAGASHIVAVSGLHVAMLFAIVLLVLGNRGWITATVGGLLLLLYVLMTGASPSVVRAALMLGLFLIAPLIGEENDSPTALALAALLILMDNPRSVCNLSFQLSFAAVAGLLLVTRPLRATLLAQPRIKALLKWKGWNALPRRLNILLLRAVRGLIRFVCFNFAATLGALVFTTPISAAAFGSVPVYAVLTNLLVLPLASVCLGGALTVLGLSLLSPALGTLAGWVAAWPMRAVFCICRTVARMPGNTLYLDGYGLSFLVFAYCMLLLACLLRERHVLRPLLSLTAALAVAVSLQRLDAASAAFTIAALDVGQGQCICAVTPDYTVVADCGGSGGSAVGKQTADWLRQHGAAQVDALILSHYDADHTNGVETLLSLMPVTTIYLPDVSFDAQTRDRLEQSALEVGAALCYVTENQTHAFSGGTLRLFAPVSAQNDNAACVSVLYSVGEYDMLITGDLDQRGEFALLEQEPLPHVELYVAGHHGSASSSSEALLQAVSPDTVWISVGRHNSFHLPSDKTLARLLASGAQVLRTDIYGNLEIGR